MEMTYNDYINNPMGRKNAVISNREIHRTFYTEKFNKILLRENGRIIYALYMDKSDYFIHINIPSEVIKDFYYDVVIKFSPKSNSSESEKTLDNYNVQFYSNDPSFVFTFAHAFIENDLFIKDLEERMSKEAIKKVAKEKNPTNQVGYVKSLYFAFLYIKSKGLMNKLQFSKNNVWKKKDILFRIMNASDKIEARQYAAEKLSISKNNKESKDKINYNQRRTTSDHVSSSNNVKTIKSTRTTNNVKNKSSKVKLSKKI